MHLNSVFSSLKLFTFTYKYLKTVTTTEMKEHEASLETWESWCEFGTTLDSFMSDISFYASSEKYVSQRLYPKKISFNWNVGFLITHVPDYGTVCIQSTKSIKTYLTMKENARSLTVTIHKFYETYLYLYFIEISHFKAVINTNYTLKLWSCFQSTIFSDLWYK